MEFRVLGPLEVVDGARHVPINGAKQRALLTILLLHANQTVSSGRRLEELRLVAQELRIDAGLRLGRQAELVAELEALIAEHPLREGLRRQHMLALYRSGRQAEALEAYHAARRALVD